MDHFHTFKNYIRKDTIMNWNQRYATEGYSRPVKCDYCKSTGKANPNPVEPENFDPRGFNEACPKCRGKQEYVKMPEHEQSKPAPVKEEELEF